MGEVAIVTKSVAFCSQPHFQEYDAAGNISNQMKLEVKCLDIGRKGGFVFNGLCVYVRRKEKAVLKDSSLHNN